MKFKFFTIAAIVASLSFSNYAIASNHTKDADKVILHAWSWSFNTIADNMKDIASAGDV